MNIEFTIKNKRRSTYLSIPQKAGVFSAEHKHVVGVEAGAAGRDLYGLGVEVVGASHLEQTHGGGFVGRPLSGAPFLSNTQPLWCSANGTIHCYWNCCTFSCNGV